MLAPPNKIIGKANTKPVADFRRLFAPSTGGICTLGKESLLVDSLNSAVDLDHQFIGLGRGDGEREIPWQV